MSGPEACLWAKPLEDLGYALKPRQLGQAQQCVCVCVCCGGSLSASKMAADAGQHRELALLLYVKHQLIFVVCRLMKRTGRISVSEFMNFNFISG